MNRLLLRLVRARGVRATACVIALVAASPASGSTYALPTPDAPCAQGSLPEQMQGRAPASDVPTGRAALGYRCNAMVVGESGTSGGYRVERYVDPAGHECAFYDSTTFVGLNIASDGPTGTGVRVVDMRDPAHPELTAALHTPAMESPHESLRLNVARGLLAAGMSSIASGPGFVDVYDVKSDCRHPQLLSSTPLGLLGHEAAFAPDGMTFYVTSLLTHTIAAVDLTDPSLPTLPWFSFAFAPHGLSVSNDGTRLYVAESAGENGFSGLTVLDVSMVQHRQLPPTVPVVSRLTWPEVSIPQNATPFTRDGHHYLVETDEFGERITGAARIIDIEDEKNPFVVSNLRLEVNQPEVYDELQDDPGNANTARGYQAHYCTVPSRIDPNIVACSFIMSGLRVFDVRRPQAPVEIAYLNRPTVAGDVPGNTGSLVMSAPAYDSASRDIWYADGDRGLVVMRLLGDASMRFSKGPPVLPGS